LGQGHVRTTIPLRILVIPAGQNAQDRKKSNRIPA
jgi:hypothetical protein